MLKKVFLHFLLGSIIFPSHGQDPKTRWVDSVFQTLKTTHKAGQLFLIPVSSRASADEIEILSAQIKTYAPGGLLITGGGPKSHITLLNKLQALSSVPLLTGIHAEWGLGQTLDSTMQFQMPLVLGAVSNDSLITAMGAEVARQMKLLGLHINFAPQADAEPDITNPLPFYSDDKIRVATKSLALVKGLQDRGVMACAVHYRQQEPAEFKKQPDTVVYFNINEVDSSDFYPFRELIRSGVKGMMTSQLHFYTRGRKAPIPASVSQVFVNDMLRETLGFKGLTFTDVSYVKAVARKSGNGESEKLAFLVGNDIMIGPQNLRKAIKKISKAASKDPSLMRQLNTSVRKILEAKYDAGLASKTILESENLLTRLNAPEALLLKHTLTEAALTVVKNDAALLPVQSLNDKKFLSLSIGKEAANRFNHYLSKYAPFDQVAIRSLSDTLALADQLKEADLVIVSIYPMATSFLKEAMPSLKKWLAQKAGVLCLFTNPYLLPDLAGFSTVIEGYADDALMAEKTAQLIFGALPSAGTLPIALPHSLPEGAGVTTGTLHRLSFSVPEAAGMDTRTLQHIKAIAAEAIDMGATPGCQVLVARHGKVVYEQSFGWLTYDNKAPVTDEIIYDLASITKVSATLQAVMYMVENKLIDINKKASVYLPELRDSNKKDITIKDILTHQAGLWPTIFFWTQTVKDASFLPAYYSTTESEEYPFPVSKDLFAHKSMKDSLWKWTVNGKIREKTDRTPYDYRYSDMGLYIMHHLAEKILHQPMEDFLHQKLYGPLGAYTTGYLPLRKFPAEQVAPTENDKTFRKSQLRGYVHDQGAAMHGGIAGHAGLFSTANDLAKLGQMWLQKGSYGGIEYFKPETIEAFTQKQYETSRRGLGWDKPAISDWNGPTTLFASSKTFGHTGFTGTSIWVDPEFDLVFIFFSNRVYPDMLNNKILNANIRPRIQEEVYKSIFSYCANSPENKSN